MKATRRISISVHWASARVAKLAMRNALERRHGEANLTPIEGVIIHEEVAELPSAEEERQRESSSVLVDCRRGSQRMRPSLGRCNKLTAHGRLSPVGPEGRAKYP